MTFNSHQHDLRLDPSSQTIHIQSQTVLPPPPSTTTNHHNTLPINLNHQSTALPHHNPKHELIDNILSHQLLPTHSHPSTSSSSLLDSRPTSSNGHPSRLIESSSDSSLNSNAPPPYYPSYPSHQQPISYNHLHPSIHSSDTRTQLFVGNLPFRVRWQDLKDLFRKAGTVLRADVSLTTDNRSKGFGTVLFANRFDALKAIEIYNGFSWQTRTLDVRLDQQDPTGAVAMTSVPAVPSNSHRLTPAPHAPSLAHQALQAPLPHSGRPGPVSNWHSGLPAPQLPAPSVHPNVEHLVAHGGLVDLTSTLSIAPTAPDDHPNPSSSDLPVFTNPNPFGIRLAHQQHHSSQSLTCADLIRSSSARLPDGTINSLSSSPPQPPPRRSSAISIHQKHVLDAMRPAFQPLSRSLNNLAPAVQSEGHRVVVNELTNNFTDMEDSHAHPSVVPGPRQDHVGPAQPRPTSTSIPSIVYPYNPITSSAIPSSGSNGHLTFPSTSASHRQSQPTPPTNISNRHLFVGNLPFNCQWQDLKDLFRGAGHILRADVAMGVDGRSRGFGTVLFATPDDARHAVRVYDGYEFHGRLLKVHFDKFCHSVVSPGAGSTGPSPHQAAQQPLHPPPSGTATEKHRERLPLHQYNSVTGYSNYFNYGTVGPNLKRVSSNNSIGFDHRNPPVHHSNHSSASGQQGFPSVQPVHEQQTNEFYSSGNHSSGGSGRSQEPHEEFQSQVPDLWASDHMSATSNLQERGLNATAAPAGPPLSPIASRRPSSFKLDVSSNSNQTAQPPTVQPIGHPNAAYGATHHSSTRPNSIPMPPPYDIAAGGVASPPLPKGIQMTPSMPAFSFQPFPATPPLLPNFFSPGIGPSTPPLSGRGRNNHAHHPNQARNNGPFYSFGMPALHPPTPMAIGKRIHSPLGHNPMFPATQDIFVGSSGNIPSSTPVEQNTNETVSGTSGFAISGESVSHQRDSSPQNPARDLLNVLGPNTYEATSSLNSSAAGLSRPYVTNSRELGESQRSSHVGDMSPNRRVTGLFESVEHPLDNLDLAGANQAHLTPLSNVDWGYSPLGINPNRRASFFVSPSHFNSHHNQAGSGTLGSSGGPLGQPHQQHGLGLGSGSYDFTSSGPFRLESKKPSDNQEEIKSKDWPVDDGSISIKARGTTTARGAGKLLCSDLFDQNDQQPATEGQKDEQLLYAFPKRTTTSALMNEDGSNRRASFDVSTLSRVVLESNKIHKPLKKSWMTNKMAAVVQSQADSKIWADQ